MPPVNGIKAAGIDRYEALILAHRCPTLRCAALTRVVSSHRSLTFTADVLIGSFQTLLSPL
jgi:hypothetical protein